MKRIIFVHGDKGGVGKTQCATRTAAAFEAAGQPLELIDGDAKNPGVDVLFGDKARCMDLRKTGGMETLFEAIANASGDVLIDMPAGGSDATANMQMDGSAEGTIDLSLLLQEIDARAVVLFVIDHNIEPIYALKAELKSFPPEQTDWIVVRNHFQDRPFNHFENSDTRKHLLEFGGKIIDMTRLDPAVVESMRTLKCNLSSFSTHPEASAIQKMRAKTAMRLWSSELQKVGLLHD
jgi:hypothetical protein